MAALSLDHDCATQKHFFERLCMWQQRYAELGHIYLSEDRVESNQPVVKATSKRVYTLLFFSMLYTNRSWRIIQSLSR